MAPNYTPSCTNGGGLKELEKLETSIENPVAYPSCARLGSKSSSYNILNTPYESYGLTQTKMLSFHKCL